MIEHRYDGEYSRRPDGLFNIWQVIDGAWCVVAVVRTHQEAVEAVRELRRIDREREANLDVPAYREPSGSDEELCRAV